MTTMSLLAAHPAAPTMPDADLVCVRIENSRREWARVVALSMELGTLTANDVRRGMGVSLETLEGWLSGEGEPHPLSADGALIAIQTLVRRKLSEHVRTTRVEPDGPWSLTMEPQR